MLPTTDVVERVLLGGNAPVVAALRKGAVIIEMSSGVPTHTRTLAASAAERGVRLIDAPVSGGVARAVTGDLAIMVGGDAAVLDDVRPVLMAMGSSMAYAGPIGAGQAVKALNNLVSAGGYLIAAEAVVVGRKFGLDAATIVDILNAPSGMNNSTKNKFKQHWLSGTFGSGFGLDLMVKDLGIALDLAATTGAATPFSTLCREMWADAAAKLGAGADHTAIAKIVEEGAK